VRCLGDDEGYQNRHSALFSAGDRTSTMAGQARRRQFPHLGVWSTYERSWTYTAFHLWVYQSNWVWLHGERQLANSDADRQVIAAAIRRLEELALTDVDLRPEDMKTSFVFEEFRLIVSPADYSDPRDYCWLLLMPTKEVWSVGLGGVRVGPSEVSSHV
jgi:hypothetical protein